MSEAVVVALITAAASVIAQLLISRTNSAKFQQSQLDTQNFLEYKIDRLTEEQKKYNNLQERVAIAERDIKSAHHRIDTIERRTEV